MIQVSTSSPANSMSSMITVPDVARHLAVSRGTVYQLMERGQLPYYKIGRCRRVLWTDVEALVARNRIGPE